MLGKYDKLKKQNQQIVSGIKQDAGNLKQVSDEYDRVSKVYSNAHIILDDIDKQFCQATKLDKVDIVFLFFATAMQCIRQYIITPFTLKNERPNDKAAAGNKKSEKSNRNNQWYNPSLENIINCPVPFDTNRQSGNVKGVFEGAGKLQHRLTLGHDPVLGWVFGTANIATSTLTNWNMKSYHVKTHASNVRGGKQANMDAITNHADTRKIFEHVGDKLLHQGMDGKLKVVCSVGKEWEHLKSDVNSKNSLPFPIVGAFSPKLANTLADYGVDTCNLLNVGKQAAYSAMINFFIAVIHRMLYDEFKHGSQTMYEVKTRKILTYSNVIASASNLIAVAAAEIVAANTGNVELAKKGMKYLDVGGLAVTIHRVVTDYKFIKQIKMEFLEKQWENIVVGDDYSFMKGESV